MVTLPAVAVAPSTQLDLTACTYLESLNIVPSALVDALVPPEFGLGPLSQLVVGIAQCDATTSTGATDRVTFGWADVIVQPIPALRPSHGISLYRIEHIAMDDLYGAAHAAVGAECRVVDDVSVGFSQLGTHATTSASGQSVWDIQVPIGVPEDGGSTSTHYREFGPATGGYAYLEGDLINPGGATMPGTFTVDPESVLFEVWGPAWTSRVAIGDTWAITDTTISFISWPTAPTPASTC